MWGTVHTSEMVHEPRPSPLIVTTSLTPPQVSSGGAPYAFEEVRELATINRKQVVAAQDLVGEAQLGDTVVSRQLRAQGCQWAQHVLEGPISWLMSLAYILITVWTTTPLNAVVAAAIGSSLPPFNGILLRA